MVDVLRKPLGLLCRQRALRSLREEKNRMISAKRKAAESGLPARDPEWMSDFALRMRRRMMWRR